MTAAFPHPRAMPALLAAVAMVLASCTQDTAKKPRPAISPISAPLSAPTPVAPPAAPDAPRPIIDLATGALVRSPGHAVAEVQKAPGGIVLNFVNAEIGEVLRAVLGELLGLNYAMHPEVKGRITVQTSAPLKRDAVLPMLERVLQANNVALMETDGLYRAVPLAVAARNGVGRVSISGAGNAPKPGHGLEIVPLRFASARQLRNVLEPFVPAGGVMQVDEARNVILVSGTGPQIASFVRLVSVFDVDWLSGMSFGLIPLEHGSPRAVAEELAKVFDAAGDGAMSGMVRIVPVERINAILLASKQPSYIGQARKWIERLDKGWDENISRIYVYNVQNSRAADLAKVLDRVFVGAVAGGAEMRTAPGSTMTRVGLDSSGGAARGPVMGPLGGGKPGGAPSETAGSAAPAKAGATEPSPPPSAEPPPGGNKGLGGARIVADEKNNALVVYATPKEYRMIEAAIRKLDVLPLQVLIEATIAEVTLNDSLKFGLQWFFKAGSSSATLSQFSDGGVSQVFPGFNYLFASGNVRVVLDALSSITDVQVISAPQLMVLDHETAMLQVGDEVPIAVQQARSVTDATAPLVNSIELRNTGVILRVTPRVNSSGIATLEVEQEVSDVIATTTSDIDSPTIQQRRVRSVVAVADGETIALGGLIRENRSKSSDGIPFLSDIPVLSFFTSSKAKSFGRTELLILLTPRIVRNQNDARAVTEELRRRLSAVEARVDLGH